MKCDIQKGNKRFVCKFDDGREGFLRFEEDRAQAGNVWKLSYIEIPEEHRHSGCADELATYALRWMRDNNIKAHIDDAYLREQWLPKHQSEFRDCLC